MNQDWADKDFYKTLGVSKTASADEIKKSYRKLAKQLHPDANPDNARAEARFKEVSEAYDVIGTDSSRAEYDELREAVASGRGGFTGGRPGAGPNININDMFGGGGGGGFGDIFGGMFGGGNRPTRGSDTETQITISFTESLTGVTAPIRVSGVVRCDICSGSGAAPGTKTSTCGSCQGSGQTVRNVGGFGVPQSCGPCRGSGRLLEKPCRECGGDGSVRKSRTISVKVPAGIQDAKSIRLSGRGEAGRNGGPAGDLIVRVRVTPHPVFSRKDDHLTISVPISIAEASLGAEVSVPVLTGSPLKLKIPAGTMSGKTFRLKGRGVQSGKRQGDLLVTVEIAVPQKLSRAAKAALEDFQKATSQDDPRAELLQRAASAPRIEPED